MESIGQRLEHVLLRLRMAYDTSISISPRQSVTSYPTLVAVSKIKPASMVQEAYNAGQRHFGENYVQELIDKSTAFAHLSDIRWHFIGNLQSNKCNSLVKNARNLFAVETVDSVKLATILNKAVRNFSPPDFNLNVFVQVNTSLEDQKNGIAPQNASSLAEIICRDCPRLRFQGFMTIGSLGHSLSTGTAKNPDFQRLVDVRSEYCNRIGVDENTVELSMGMSHDFEHAVTCGSTNVRVGSLIFGERN